MGTTHLKVIITPCIAHDHENDAIFLGILRHERNAEESEKMRQFVNEASSEH